MVLPNLIAAENTKERPWMNSKDSITCVLPWRRSWVTSMEIGSCHFHRTVFKLPHWSPSVNGDCIFRIDSPLSWSWYCHEPVDLGWHPHVWSLDHFVPVFHRQLAHYDDWASLYIRSTISSRSLRCSDERGSTPSHPEAADRYYSAWSKVCCSSISMPLIALFHQRFKAIIVTLYPCRQALWPSAHARNVLRCRWPRSVKYFVSGLTSFPDEWTDEGPVQPSIVTIIQLWYSALSLNRACLIRRSAFLFSRRLVLLLSVMTGVLRSPAPGCARLSKLLFKRITEAGEFKWVSCS